MWRRSPAEGRGLEVSRGENGITKKKKKFEGERKTQQSNYTGRVIVLSQRGDEGDE